MDGSTFNGTFEALLGIGLVAGLGIALVVGGLVYWLSPNDTSWQVEAVQRGHGLYCPDNGQFAWKGECK